MIWEMDVRRIPGTYAKVYIAKITGKHPEFRFRRQFLWREIRYDDGYNHYERDIGDFGVFEESVSRFDRKTDEQLSRERTWFMLANGDECTDIRMDEVLPALKELRRDYGNVC